MTVQHCCGQHDSADVQQLSLQQHRAMPQ